MSESKQCACHISEREHTSESLPTLPLYEPSSGITKRPLTLPPSYAKDHWLSDGRQRPSSYWPCPEDKSRVEAEAEADFDSDVESASDWSSDSQSDEESYYDYEGQFTVLQDFDNLTGTSTATATATADELILAFGILALCTRMALTFWSFPLTEVQPSPSWY